MKTEEERLEVEIEGYNTYDKRKDNDEVFTPNSLINDMLDKLPVEVWSNPDKTWLDPCAGLGKSLPLINLNLKTNNRIIKGCQSNVWLNTDLINDKILYTADSDAIITKGMIALMVRVLSNQKAEDIVKADMDFINQIGLNEHLSPTRANGLLSMINEMKKEALKRI